MRKAQGSAATVVGIIALLLVFYILFIPPEEREALLYGTDENGTYGSVSVGKASNRTLLLATPGKLDFVQDEEIDHTIPNVVLSEQRSAQVLSDAPPFVLRRNWLENKQQTITFGIQDTDKTDNVLLVFEAPVRTGVVSVDLNGNNVYEGPIDSQTPPPIQLRKALLASTNELSFSLAGVGLAFWRTNELQLRNVQIIGDVSQEEFARSAAVVTLLDEEARNLKEAQLYFYPVCDPDDIGIVVAMLNGKTAYEAKPDCDSINRIEIDPATLRTGGNDLGFRTTRGTLRLEQIRLHTELEETNSYIEYFYLNSTDMNRISEKSRRVMLRVQFVDDKKDKQGRISVNGRLIAFDQKNASILRDVSDAVVDGNNYVELRPESVLNVVKLELRLE